MSDLTVFKNKSLPAAFAGIDPQAESLSDGIGGGFGVIHYTGKNWSLQMRGERHNFVRQDDGTPLSYIDAIILRQMPVKSRTYYPKGAWERGESGAPLCSSLDGVHPDVNVKEQQANVCALCPRYEVKTNAEGRKGRECRDNKRLALLLVPSLSKQLLGAPLMEPVLLRVPAASLVALGNMGDDMARQGWPYYAFITRIGFVPTSEYPQLTFKPLQELTDKEAPVVLSMREESQTLRITGESEINKPRPISSPQVAATTAQPAAVSRIETEAPTKPRTVPPVVTLDLEANDDSGIDAGFGDVEAPAPAPKAAAKPKSNVVKLATPPTEEVEEASADLDARIANLLKTD